MNNLERKQYYQRKRYLESKRLEILEEIKPICKAFNIKDYDYEILETNQEVLRIGTTVIGCTANSNSAVIDELIGYVFVNRWCKNRSLGAFRTQTINRITEYWDYRDRKEAVRWDK